MTRMTKEEKELRRVLIVYARGLGKTTIHKYTTALVRAVEERCAKVAEMNTHPTCNDLMSTTSCDECRMMFAIARAIRKGR